MAENVNPLLFSASSSVFDDLTSSAMLLPPQTESQAQSSAFVAQSDGVGGSNGAAGVSSNRGSPAPPTLSVSSINPSSQPNSQPGSHPPSRPSSQHSASVGQGSGAPTPTPPPFINSQPGILPTSLPSTSLFQPPTQFGAAPPPPTNFMPRVTPAVTKPYALPNSVPLFNPGPPSSVSRPHGTKPTPPPPFMPAPSNVMFTPAPPPPLLAKDSAAAPPPASFAPAPLTEANWAPPVFGVSPDKPELSVVPPSFESMASDQMQQRYRPVIPHWFYATNSRPVLWKPFSFNDSFNLEEAFRQGGCGLVSTDGGRYDVEVSSRLKRPVYWNDSTTPSSENINTVRRCSWFKKGALDVTPQPYDEETAEKLEAAYKECMESGTWQKQVEVSGDSPGLVVLSSPHSMNHYGTGLPAAAFPTSVSIAESQAPDTVKRGADDFEVSDGEADQVDHLVFLVHGIGPFCDLSFRSVEECVDTFRELGGELVSQHFKQSVESGRVGRVEVLPVSWHKALHSESDGIDERLKPITLRSIPMLREFTNDTILDVLLYTSPAYCQLIIDTVSRELNRMYKLFKKRNPSFSGGVSVAGHSLGSVILFDILMHQSSETAVQPGPEAEQPVADAGEQLVRKGVGSVVTASSIRAKRSQLGATTSEGESYTSSVNFEIGMAGTGQPSIVYPQLLFQPQAVFLLGSPIAMFLTVRGLTQLSPQYKLPTCPHVFNIFHPYDPVAYRLETLIHPELTDLRPVLVPHHKGRKRMHLELKDTLERVGSDIKQRIMDSIQFTWNKLYHLYSGTPEQQNEKMEQVMEEQLGKLNLEAREGVNTMEDQTAQKADVGELNAGRRIDYVLQEKPYESFTEYIFALQAHLSYWKSEDTLLLMLKEIYSSMGVSCDSDLPQPSGTSGISSPVSPQSPRTASFTDSVTGPQFAAPPAEPPVPAPPVPMMFNTDRSVGSPPMPVPLLPPVPSALVPPSAAALPPMNTGTGVAAPLRVLGGRPVVDPLSLPQTIGMDPTAEPQVAGAAVPPPPTVATMSFNRKKLTRR